MINCWWNRLDYTGYLVFQNRNASPTLFLIYLKRFLYRHCKHYIKKSAKIVKNFADFAERLWRISDFAGPPLQQANALFDALRAVFDFSFYAFWGVFGRVLAEFFFVKNDVFNTIEAIFNDCKILLLLNLDILRIFCNFFCNCKKHCFSNIFCGRLWQSFVENFVSSTIERWSNYLQVNRQISLDRD